MKKKFHFYLIAVFLLAFSLGNKAIGQTIQIVNNQTQSGNNVIGRQNYLVSENIYTEAEIGASNFTTAASAIDHIDFNVFAIGSNTTINNFNISFKRSSFI